MASNGLVANASKTALMFMNLKQTKNEQGEIKPISIMIGETEVTQETSTKLLGITLDQDQKWISQISNLNSSLNSRLYLIKRLSNSISKDRLKKIADSLYMSKIRYGVQMFGNVRTKEEEAKQKTLGSIQVSQNKLARFLNGNKLMDKIPTVQLLTSRSLYISLTLEINSIVRKGHKRK